VVVSGFDGDETRGGFVLVFAEWILGLWLMLGNLRGMGGWNWMRGDASRLDDRHIFELFGCWLRCCLAGNGGCGMMIDRFHHASIVLLLALE